MSEPYQIASLIPDGIPAADGIPLCHRVLREDGIIIDSDSLLILHDTDVDEPEPESILDEETTLQRLITWPTLGSIDYAGPEGMVTVSYLGLPGHPLLVCVLISALQRAVERTNSLPRYRNLATHLHSELEARRTIMEWGLEMKGFSPPEEIARLKRGEFLGEYSLDLR